MKKITTLAAYLILALTTSNIYGQIALGDDRIVLTNERRVNTDYLEFSPVFYKDGVVFVTTQNENLLYSLIKDKRADGIQLMSMFWSQRDEEGFLKTPERFSNELISKVHEGPMTFDRTASKIFFTRNEQKEQAPDKLYKMQIYTAEKDSNEIWGNFQKLPFNNIAYNFMHPSVSANDDQLFIASDVPGGQGGMDLYMVKKVGDSWGEMVNLGPTVNTPGNEVFPYIAADGALYFSSDGHGGLGGLDLFYTTQTGGKWATPENLGAPFSSDADDLGFIVDSENRNGYFSSDRKGGFGGDDIYSFHVDGPFTPYAANRNLNDLVIKDENGNPMEGVTISAINFNEIGLSGDDENQVKLLAGDDPDNFILDVNSGEMGEKGVTGSTGTANVPLRRGSSVIKVEKEGYLPEYVVVTPGTDISKLNINMRKAINCVPLDGELRMQATQATVAGAEIHLVDVESKEAIVVYSDAKGKFDYCLPCNRTFAVYAVRSGANSAPALVSTKEVPCAQGNRIPLTLYIGGPALYAGMTIQLPNIYFNFDDASLRPDAYPDLNEVVAMMKAYPGMKLELASHTDSRGGTAYNQDLSKRRSASVLKYLKSKGVEGSRLVPRGYGESQLRNRCSNGVACSEREHQYNRRTEVKILELGDPELASSPSAPVAETNTKPTVMPNEDPLAGEPDAEKGGQADEDDEQPVSVPVSDNSNGSNFKAKSFTVVAGTFANQDNAQRRHELLTKMGYPNAAIVKQARSGLYAVYVNTFDAKTDAFGLVKTLANQQLSAYVLRQ